MFCRVSYKTRGEFQLFMLKDSKLKLTLLITTRKYVLKVS